MKRLALALTLAFAAPAMAGTSQIVRKPKDGHLTSVTSDPHVTVTMGLKLTPVTDPGDSVQWWRRRQEGWKRWQDARKAFPEVQSPQVYVYLNALAEGFNATLPEPRTRFHFHVADTLNPSIWPAGGGFFVVHAGVFAAIRDDRRFAFLMALELAHEYLGHNYTPIRAGDIKWEPGTWTKGSKNFGEWPVFFWAMLVGRDPIERGKFSYTLQQESDALELVYRFFAANAWTYDDIRRTIAHELDFMNKLKGSSSLALLHKNLGLAVQLPHARPETRLLPVDSVLSTQTYTGALREMERSSLQRYRWLLELVAYRDLYDSKLAGLSALEARNDELQDRDEIIGAKLARVFMKGVYQMRDRKWNDVLKTAREGMTIDPTAEPFQWLKMLAFQNLHRFDECLRDGHEPWRSFDFRRELMVGQCLFFDGRVSDAEAHFQAYRRRYPFEADGAFWLAATDIRMRRESDDIIVELDRFWGDRPYTRAIKTLYYGFLKKPSLAKAALDRVDTEIDYPEEEWGVLESTRAWFTETYSVYNERDASAKDSQVAAEKKWSLADIYRLNLPREPLQSRTRN